MYLQILEQKKIPENSKTERNQTIKMINNYEAGID